MTVAKPVLKDSSCLPIFLCEQILVFQNKWSLKRDWFYTVWHDTVFIQEEIDFMQCDMIQHSYKRVIAHEKGTDFIGLSILKYNSRGTGRQISFFKGDK